MVLSMLAEPMYLSELARKSQMLSDRPTITLSNVAEVLAIDEIGERVDFVSYGYEPPENQSTGSAHRAANPEVGEGGTKDWYDHTIAHNTDADVDQIDSDILDIINPGFTVDDKVEIVDNLSTEGNTISRIIENVAQSEFVRQFRNYDVTRVSDYNSPEGDFYVEDNGERNYGLFIEVSARYENPIDQPYVTSKVDSAFNEDADLVILAPRFTNTQKDKYEYMTDADYHAAPEDERVHLHNVPTDTPEVYRPFSTNVPNETDRGDGGFPVVVPDSNEVQQLLARQGHVADDYPAVTQRRRDFITNCEEVSRDVDVIPESGFRTQLREAVEPLLYDFGRAYKIEQYLIDTYWDRGLSTSEIGSLTGVSGRTIRRWLSDQHWDLVTRGTGTPIDDSVIEIWSRMYNGQEPFPRQFTGYEIQALFNRHPFFRLDDWREWFSLSQEERSNIMTEKTGAFDKVGYTIMLSGDSRLFPSYDFIINSLRANGVEIRDGFFNETGLVEPTGLALEYMLNRNINTIRDDGEVSSRDVVQMRSALEVDVAEYFSSNEVPYAFEPFLIPSPFDVVSDAPSSIRELIDSEPRNEVLAEWRRIYNKHNLDSDGDVPPEEGLELIGDQTIEPDFALYPNAELEQKSEDWSGWETFSNIVEVSGPYGAGIVTDWADWYRVQGVARKELVYKLLGVWQDTYFILTDDTGISEEVRNDEHYIIVNPTQLDAGLEGALETMGVR